MNCQYRHDYRTYVRRVQSIISTLIECWFCVVINFILFLVRAPHSLASVLLSFGYISVISKRRKTFAFKTYPNRTYCQMETRGRLFVRGLSKDRWSRFLRQEQPNKLKIIFLIEKNNNFLVKFFIIINFSVAFSF